MLGAEELRSLQPEMVTVDLGGRIRMAGLRAGFCPANGPRLPVRPTLTGNRTAFGRISGSSSAESGGDEESKLPNPSALSSESPRLLAPRVCILSLINRLK